MTSRGCSQCMGHLDGAGDTRAETNAIVGARHVVVHGLGNPDDPDSLLVEPDRVREGVVSTDRDQRVDAQPIEIGEHLRQ